MCDTLPTIDNMLFRLKGLCSANDKSIARRCLILVCIENRKRLKSTSAKVCIDIIEDCPEENF